MDRPLNEDGFRQHEKYLQNSLDNRVFGNISSPKLKEENVNVNWNTHCGVLRDFATLVSTIVRICDYEMVLGGNISMACNGIKLEKVKHHVKENWYKFYQSESQKAYANAYR